MIGRVTGLAAAALVAATALLGVPSTRAEATSGPCVAVIVDSGAGLSGRCTGWTPGLTGLAALSATGHTYRFASSGLVCSIDGFPAGCQVDPTHYWSYWHRAPGASGWAYSIEGAGTYHPAASSTDGWAYQNGTARQPRSIGFATICPPPAPSPTTRPSPPPTSAPAPPVPAPRATTPPDPATHPTAAGGPSRAGQPPAANSGAGRPAAGAGGAVGSANSPSHSTSPRAVAIAGVTRVGSPSPASDLPAGAPTAGAAAPSPAAGIRPLLIAGLGALVAAALAAAAWRRSRHPG